MIRNEKLRKAFTMIELIFVIVIIGILTSIAIPKLIASRDDAIATVCVATARQFIQEVALYYTVNGKFTNISEISNIPVDNTERGFVGDIDLSVNPAQFYCDNEPLLQYAINRNLATTLSVTSLSPSSPPAAFIADAKLTENNFYRTYVLGGYTN